VITPAQPVDPTSYYSFIDLTTFHHGAGRRNKSSRSRKHTRSRRHLHVVDRPISFLDLDESDARILDHPPNTNSPRLSSSDPTSIGGTTGHGPSFSAWSAPRSRDLLLSTMAPDSLRASLCLEVDQLPPYEEAAGSAPVYLVENTVRRIASRNSRSSYRVDRAKVALLPSSQDPMSPPPNQVVLQPTRSAQRDFRPLPPIPPSRQTHVISPTPPGIGEQSLHIAGQVVLQRDRSTPPEPIGLHRPRVPSPQQGCTP
jgi:hypothetical protein